MSRLTLSVARAILASLALVMDAQPPTGTFRFTFLPYLVFLETASQSASRTPYCLAHPTRQPASKFGDLMH
jgi:hypothetical protein